MIRIIGRIMLAAFALLAATNSFAASKPPGCPRGDCGIRNAKPYPHIVIGRLLVVLSDAEMRRLYHWAKANKTWAAFPDSEQNYLERNRVLLISAGKNVSPTLVHMSHEEYRRAPNQIGDYVRYRPRNRAAMTQPATPEHEAMFSMLAGCVATLCSPEDSACQKHYPEGMFQAADGVQVSIATGKPLRDGVTIDTMSMLRKAAEPAKAGQ